MKAPYSGPRYDVPAGDPGRPCKGCGHNIHWWMSVERDGTTRRVKCLNRAQFKKPPWRMLDLD